MEQVRKHAKFQLGLMDRTMFLQARISFFFFFSLAQGLFTFDLLDPAEWNLFSVKPGFFLPFFFLFFWLTLLTLAYGQNIESSVIRFFYFLFQVWVRQNGSGTVFLSIECDISWADAWLILEMLINKGSVEWHRNATSTRLWIKSVTLEPHIVICGDYRSISH